MDSLLFLIIAGGMVFFLFKFLIFPYFNTNNEDNYNTRFIVTEIKEDRIPRTTQVNANLSPELYKKLNTYCENNHVTKTSIINKAVGKYLDEIENVKSNIVGQ